MKIACVFPGQGSQFVGMLAELAKTSMIVRETFEQASDLLHTDFWSLTTKGPEDELNSTLNTQPIMLAAGVAVWRVWSDQGGCQPAMMAGHSFGEYTALVNAGVLDYAIALPLARERGRLMQSAVPQNQGAMAAIVGLENTRIDEICTTAAQGQVVAAANFNSPGQVVIAGHTAAVERAMSMATDAGARRVLRLAVSVPAHCALMESAASILAQRLAETSFKPPQIPVVQNVDVKTHEVAREIRQALALQLHHPVRWTETIHAMQAKGVDVILEMGPGRVLTGLNKRIDRRLKNLSLQDSNGLKKALQHCEEVE